MHSQPPHEKFEIDLLWDVQLRKKWGFNCTGQSSQTMHPEFSSAGAQYQCSTTTMGGQYQSPILLKNKTRKGKKKSNSILNTPSRDCKSIETFRVKS